MEEIKRRGNTLIKSKTTILVPLIMSFKIHWFKQRSTSNRGKEADISSKRLLMEAGRIVKERREEYGISRSELAERTRITTTVLEAIEEGWEKKLPEKAYLCSMLTILESELNLQKNTLNGILQGDRKSSDKKSSKTFTLRNIDIFRTWQGNLLYLILMLISIFGLNYQQRYLSKVNSHLIGPITPNLSSKPIVQENLSESIESNNPAGTNLNFKTSRSNPFISLIKGFKKVNAVGLLELNLNQESELTIFSESRYQANFNEVKGKITLKLIPPIKVKIIPPPTKNDQIIWAGKSYLPRDVINGHYNFDE